VGVGRRIDRQQQVGVDLAQKEERPRLAGQQQGVLAPPAQPAFSARATSMTGAESTKTRAAWGTAAIRSASRCRRARSTLW
jgi:hypothetical protein